MGHPRTTIFALIGAVVVLAVILGVRLAVMGGGGHAGAGPSVGGPFTLVDHTGKTVTDADFQGRYKLIFFGYTFCPDVCPTTLGTVAAALDQLAPEQRARLAPLFVSVDPERDTPEVLREYVAAFHPAIIGLTGTPEQVTAAMKAYKVYAAKAASADPGSYTVDHSAITYLMAPDGTFLAHFPHGTGADEMAALLKKTIQ